MKDSDLLIKYRDYLYSKQLTDGTIDNNISIITRELFDKGVKIDITKVEYRKILSSMRNRLSKNTMYSYVNVIKRFYDYLIDFKFYNGKNPFSSSVVKITASKPKNVLYEDEILDIYKIFDMEDKTTGYQEFLFDFLY
ncbi:hypothetical protein ASS24_16155, partial [Listeria monocytogenes]|nr:hypothetical protein [Listeria monocytogenes]